MFHVQPQTIVFQARTPLGRERVDGCAGLRPEGPGAAYLNR